MGTGYGSPSGLLIGVGFKRQNISEITNYIFNIMMYNFYVVVTKLLFQFQQYKVNID